MSKTYKVIKSDGTFGRDMQLFSEKVSDYLDEGWELVGGVAVYTNPAQDNECLYQALVQED